MPQLDLRVEHSLSYETQLLLTLLIEELNTLRGQIGLAPLMPEDLRQAARAYVRAHPRQGRN